MSKYCQNCYSKIKDEHQFCTQCGTKFEEKVSAVNKEEKNNINQEVLIPSSSHVKFIMWGIVLCIFIFAISNFTKESDQSVSNIANSLPVELNNNQIKKTVGNAEVKDKLNKPNYLSENTFKAIFDYKEWKIESIDNLLKIITNGKLGAEGHEFGIVKLKEKCDIDYLYLTFSSMYDLSPYIGQDITFKITIDDVELIQKLPILSSIKLMPTLNIVSFSNFVLNDYALSLFRKGRKIKVDILESNELYNKFDIKSEEFSLEGFIANYDRTSDICKAHNPSTKITEELKKSVEEFLSDYSDIANNRKINKLDMFYSRTVDYYNLGLTSIDKIKKDKSNYMKRWDIMRWKIKNIESINIENEDIVVVFNIDFIAYNHHQKNGSQGIAKNTFILDSKNMIIKSEKQKIIKNNKIYSINELLNCKIFKKNYIKNLFDNSTIIELNSCTEQSGEGIIPVNYLLIKYNNQEKIYFDKDNNFISNVTFIDNHNILLNEDNNIISRNSILNLDTLEVNDLGGGVATFLNYGDNSRLFYKKGVKTYILREDGSSEGAHWYDVIVNNEGKVIKYISLDSGKCVEISKLLGKQDSSLLTQSLTDCVNVNY
jgi:hypothetical protein